MKILHKNRGRGVPPLRSVKTNISLLSARGIRHL